MTCGLVLAAGAGERFGGPKQIAELHGRPLLEHVLMAMEAAAVERTVVVLGARADEVRAAVPLHGAEPVVARDWREGMAASLRAGVEALADADAVVVALGDQPLVSARAIDRIVTARGHGALAVRATYDGTPGHPVLLERALFDRLRALRGDEGARAVLREVAVRDVACDGLGRPDDIDTRTELEGLLGSPNSKAE